MLLRGTWFRASVPRGVLASGDQVGSLAHRRIWWDVVIRVAQRLHQSLCLRKNKPTLITWT